VRIARLQKKIGWYEWQQQVITSMAQSLSLYFDLIYAAENLRVRQSAVSTKGSVLVNACFARAPQQVIHVGTTAHGQSPGNPRGGHLSFCFKLHGNLHFPRLTLGQQDKLVLAQMHSMQTSTSDVVGLVGC